MTRVTTLTTRSREMRQHGAQRFRMLKRRARLRTKRVKCKTGLQEQEIFDTRQPSSMEVEEKDDSGDKREARTRARMRGGRGGARGRSGGRVGAGR